METEKVMDLVKHIYDEIKDLDSANFQATIGTVMKVYSVEHDIDMSQFIIGFACGILDMEKEFNF